MKSCNQVVHQKIEQLHFAQGKAAVSLKQHLQHQCVFYPNNAMADTTVNNSNHEPDDLEENEEEWFEVEDGNICIENAQNVGSVGVPDDVADTPPCEASKSPTGNRKFKAQSGRQRTHNKQTLVWPCGIIYAHAKFYGVEAVLNVLLFIKNIFSVPGTYKLEHLIYNTNCDTKQQVLVSGDPFFSNMGMCVDIIALSQQTQGYPYTLSRVLQPSRLPRTRGTRWKVGFQYINCQASQHMAGWISHNILGDVTSKIQLLSQ
jgi:hypothetical protein